ncbi:MAG: type II toxin-antitoxin system prevent-host-death family antitoxin [Verrucomicrobia bacterium]|nr:type II toxin-antitoxin system prevent-host-death family antitoxin [Verrucomicrobiota bacterium]
MTTIKLSEAKAHLGRYAREAAKGQQFIISERNKPVAIMGPAPQGDTGICPKIGIMDGQAVIPADFDQAIPEFENDFYGK